MSNMSDNIKPIEVKKHRVTTIKVPCNGCEALTDEYVKFFMPVFGLIRLCLSCAQEVANAIDEELK